MYDPLYAGSITQNEVKFWDVKNNFPLKIHALIMLQGKMHAVLLEAYFDDDALMIDRLKFQCDIQPRYMAKITISSTLYYMIYIPFEVVHPKGSPKIKFRPDLLWNSSLEKITKLEMCKIMIFWFLAGLARITEETLLAQNSNLMGNRKFSKTLIDKYMDDDKLVKEAQKRVTENLDMDHIRGIVCGTRQPERDIRNIKQLKLSVDYKQYLETFELRLELVMNLSPQDLRDEMMGVRVERDIE